jgi:hypothetical protein
MRAIGKVMCCAVVLIIFGTAADTLAKYPNFVVGKTYCTCRCAVKDAGMEEFGWENAGTCIGANGKTCSITKAGKKLTGRWEDCAICKADIHGACNYVRVEGTPLRPQARPPAGESK